MGKVYFLGKTGYDSSIDYIKGLSILFVVLTHCINVPMHQYSLFCLWGDMAVPLFLIMQVFHAYKKGYDGVTLKLSKIWFRVLKPFLLIQVGLFILMCIGGGDFLELCKEFVTSGGQGAGSYYVWIYVQFAIILPQMGILFSKVKKKSILLVMMIFLSEVLEILSCYVQIAPWLYRLLMFRYLFLIYIGILILKEGIYLSRKIIVVSLLSAVVLLFFQYSEQGIKQIAPLFYPSGWKVFHWPCYFWVGGLLLYAIRGSYDYTAAKLRRVNDLIVKMGKYSYEIFLCQMVYFFFLAYVEIRFGLQDSWPLDILILLVSPFVCITPVLVYKEYRLTINNKKR